MIIGMPVEAEEILQRLRKIARIFNNQYLHGGAILCQAILCQAILCQAILCQAILCQHMSCQDGVRLVRKGNVVKIGQNPYRVLIIYCSWEELT